jgi:hypothetical protein
LPATAAWELSFLELVESASASATAQRICVCLSDALRRQAYTDDSQLLLSER